MFPICSFRMHSSNSSWMSLLWTLLFSRLSKQVLGDDSDGDDDNDDDDDNGYGFNNPLNATNPNDANRIYTVGETS